MAQDTLNKIKEAELAANQLVKDAKAQAEQILTAARQELKDYSSQVISKAKADAQTRLNEVQSGMNEALESARKQADAQVAQFRKGTVTKTDAAVQLVINHII